MSHEPPGTVLRVLNLPSLPLQIICQSESTQEKASTPPKVTRPLQSTEEERRQRPGKHQILNVAERDLEGIWS